MSKIINYNFMKELEDNYRKSFSLCSTNNIIIFPPVLKKIGLIYYVVYPVIERFILDKDIQIKRPIGLININPFKKSKINIYDFKNYEFTKYAENFNRIYYTVNEKSNYLPNNSETNIEKLKVALELLSQSINELFPFRINNNKYNNYLEKIKNLIPKNYLFFYDNLIYNNIKILSEEEAKTRLSKYKNIHTIKEKSQDYIINKELFIDKINKEFFSFIKDEMVINLKNKGSYNKLCFFNYIGNEFKQILCNLDKYEQCFSTSLTYKEKNKNIQELIENNKIKSIKFYSKLNNKSQNDLSIDILSKILITFLNALLVEELHKKILPIFEQEISEGKTIFTEEIKKIEECDEKNKLIEIFNNLCKDYYEVDDNKFSNIFYGYLQTYKQRPNLNLIKLD